MTPDGAEVTQGVNRMKRLAERNPLGLAIGGAAVGFIAGVLLPSTRVEDERIGPMADEVKATAAEAGREALDRGKDVVQEAGATAIETAKERGREEGEELSESLQEKAREAAPEKASDNLSVIAYRQHAVVTRVPSGARLARAGAISANVSALSHQGEGQLWAAPRLARSSPFPLFPYKEK